MRFKKYILLSLVLCGFAACSDDNEIEIPKAPVLEKAQLALAIKSEEGAVTKTGETTPTDADVNTLTVGVFGVDGWSVIYTKDATPNLDGTKTCMRVMLRSWLWRTLPRLSKLNWQRQRI